MVAVLALAACSEREPDIQLSSGGSTAGGDDPALVCGDSAPFPASALEGPTGVEDSGSAGGGTALRNILGKREDPGSPAPPMSGWRLLLGRPDEVLFGAGRASDLTTVTVRSDADGWKVSSWGECRTRPYRDGSPEHSSSTTVVPTTTVVEGEPPADPDAARAEIDQAFHTAFDAGIADEQRFAVVEDGPELLPAGRQAAAKFPEAAASISATVHGITFIDPTHAAVNFELLYEGAMLLGPQDGQAVYLDGHWKVSRETRCDIIEQAGVACP